MSTLVVGKLYKITACLTIDEASDMCSEQGCSSCPSNPETATKVVVRLEKLRPITLRLMTGNLGLAMGDYIWPSDLKEVTPLEQLAFESI